MPHTRSSRRTSFRSALIFFGFVLPLAPVPNGTANAQVLVANDDSYGIPYGQTLVVEAFGVLENDTLDGENAGESGATAELVTDVSHGTLALSADGSFTYTPGAGFDRSDSFVYRALAGAASDEATVTLAACSGGPQVFTCWNESAFLAKAAELGHPSFQEGFEDDAVWGSGRSPDTALGVIRPRGRWTFRVKDRRMAACRNAGPHEGPPGQGARCACFSSGSGRSG